MESVQGKWLRIQGCGLPTGIQTENSQPKTQNPPPSESIPFEPEAADPAGGKSAMLQAIRLVLSSRFHNTYRDEKNRSHSETGGNQP